MFKLILEVHDTVAILCELETLYWRITDTVPVHIISFSVLCGSTCTGDALLCLHPRAGPSITEQSMVRDEETNLLRYQNVNYRGHLGIMGRDYLIGIRRELIYSSVET